MSACLAALAKANVPLVLSVRVTVNSLSMLKNVLIVALVPKFAL
jgi:hypothetical protein